MTERLTELPSIENAQLPVKYVAARTALTECSKMDECQNWADKAKALASYAKQSDDQGLRKLATRIQARAIRRCSELLKQILISDEVQPANELWAKRHHSPAAGGQDPESRGFSTSIWILGSAMGCQNDQLRFVTNQAAS